jgi:hypothetical protein
MKYLLQKKVQPVDVLILEWLCKSIAAIVLAEETRHNA